ncbi:MAG: hypothetical protein ICV85_21480 [Tolypothrix sp. T3-bin4]|nr:hypothetical protein [Tolypothrix sp. T3-bin4]
MSEEKSTMKPEVGVEGDNFDPHIVPAETGARIEREGDNFKTTPNKGKEATAKTNDQTDAESIDSTGGYTVDKEGLVNNYAIEPEMYVNEPGDLREKEEDLTAERINELEEINEDKDGDLTMDGDKRGKGPGVI